MKMKAYIQKLSLRTFFLSMLFATVFTSCDKDNEAEDLFGKNADARLEQQEKELREALLSSEHGWKAVYFTDDPRYTDDDQQLGGWSFVFDFNDNKHVTMASDFSAETLTPQESEYDVRLGSTIKLSFVTKNYIHLLSDSDNFPTSNLSGQGYKGDFEFLYYGKDGEDLIFRSNRFQIELRFKKATAQDWSDLGEARQTGSLLATSDLKLQINTGGETSEYDMAYAPTTRFAEIEDNDLSFGIAPLADGLKAVKPIPVGDQIAIDFVYDAANDWFISELDNGDTAKITVDVPDPTAHLFDDFNYSFQVFQGSPALDSSGAFVTGFNEAYANVEASTDIDGILFGFFLVPSNNTIQYILYDDSKPEGSRFTVTLRSMTYQIDIPNDRIILSDNGGWDIPALEPLLQPLEEILFSPEGWTMIDTGNTFEGDPIFGFSQYNDFNSVFYTYTVN